MRAARNRNNQPPHHARDTRTESKRVSARASARTSQSPNSHLAVKLGREARARRRIRAKQGPWSRRRDARTTRRQVCVGRREPARAWLLHAWSGGPGVDAVVTALVLAAPRPSVSAASNSRADLSATRGVRVCGDEQVSRLARAGTRFPDAAQLSTRRGGAAPFVPDQQRPRRRPVLLPRLFGSVETDSCLVGCVSGGAARRSGSRSVSRVPSPRRARVPRCSRRRC